MEQLKIPQTPQRNKSFRKPSFSASSQANQSMIVMKKKFINQRNSVNGKSQEKLNLADSISSKLRVCNGQKLTFEVMKGNSEQKTAQFMHKYANDPFMRRKFQKTVEKLDKDKTKQKRDYHPSLMNHKPDVGLTNHSITTFREQIKRQSQKTVKLMINCQQLVEELNKNKFMDPEKDSKDNQKNIYLSRKFYGWKELGSITDRV